MSMGVKKVSYGIDEIWQVECCLFMYDDLVGYNLSYFFVLDLIEELDLMFWVVIYDGLNYFNMWSGKCEVYFVKVNIFYCLISNVLQCLYEDKLGNIWVGFDWGVNKMKLIYLGFVFYFLEFIEIGIVGVSVFVVV